jgi:hypothetical protein
MDTGVSRRTGLGCRSDAESYEPRCRSDDAATDLDPEDHLLRAPSRRQDKAVSENGVPGLAYRVQTPTSTHFSKADGCMWLIGFATAEISSC